MAGRNFWNPVEPFVANGFYTNSLMDEGVSAVQANFKGNYTRLVALKNKYDPTNVFRLNANIAPMV
ncbi:MAG: BBE domain-containing protein [Rhodospirillaceae bacterium]|nr:BBE domain-containing protein [Rhodospirillaceae bacterium]